MNPFISMIPVHSSAISAIGFQGGTLKVKFHSGLVYDLPNVPFHVYLGLMQAGSKGTYYNQNIRGKYK